MVDVVKSDQGTGKVQGLLKEDVVRVNCDDHPDTCHHMSLLKIIVKIQWIL